MSIAELDLSIILNLIQEDDFAIWHKPRMHSWNTCLSGDLECARVCCWRRGRRTRCSRDSRTIAWSTLTSITAMSYCVTTDYDCELGNSPQTFASGRQGNLHPYMEQQEPWGQLPHTVPAFAAPHVPSLVTTPLGGAVPVGLPSTGS